MVAITLVMVPVVRADDFKFDIFRDCTMICKGALAGLSSLIGLLVLVCCFFCCRTRMNRVPGPADFVWSAAEASLPATMRYRPLFTRRSALLDVNQRVAAPPPSSRVHTVQAFPSTNGTISRTEPPAAALGDGNGSVAVTVENGGGGGGGGVVSSVLPSGVGAMEWVGVYYHSACSCSCSHTIQSNNHLRSRRPTASNGSSSHQRCCLFGPSASDTDRPLLFGSDSSSSSSGGGGSDDCDELPANATPARLNLQFSLDGGDQYIRDSDLDDSDESPRAAAGGGGAGRGGSAEDDPNDAPLPDMIDSPTINHHTTTMAGNYNRFQSEVITDSSGRRRRTNAINVVIRGIGVDEHGSYQISDSAFNPYNGYLAFTKLYISSALLVYYRGQCVVTAVAVLERELRDSIGFSGVPHPLPHPLLAIIAGYAQDIIISGQWHLRDADLRSCRCNRMENGTFHISPASSLAVLRDSGYESSRSRSTARRRKHSDTANATVVHDPRFKMPVVALDIEMSDVPSPLPQSALSHSASQSPLLASGSD